MKTNALGVKQPNAAKGANIWPAGLAVPEKNPMGIEVTPALANNLSKIKHTTLQAMKAATVNGNVIWPALPAQRKSRKARKPRKVRKTRRAGRR